MKPLVYNLTFKKAPDADKLQRFKLSLADSSSDCYHFKIHGDLVREGAPRTVLYAFAGDYCIARICPRHEILGLTKRLTGKREGSMGHFVDWIPVFSLPEDFRIELYADEMGKFDLASTLHHGKSLEGATHLGSITGSKRFAHHAHSAFQPLRLSCFGRSGSSLMMRYLSFHPQVAVAGRHPYEFTVAAFYYGRARLLGSNCQDFFTDQLNQSRRRHQNPWYQYEQVSWMGGAAEPFFGREQVAREIEHCRASVDGFYTGVKAPEAGRPMYFCEKDGSGRSGHDEYREVWPGARRLFLVRDFRDNCASILAYCRRKGSREFGLQHFDTEEAWLKTMAAKARELLAEYQSGREASVFVFYEQLIRDEQAALSDTFAALGLESSHELVAQIVKEARRLDDSQAVGGHATSGSASQSIGRWRQDLPAELAAIVEREFSESMAGFGYAN
jgi:hypothetical protein